MAGRSDRIRFGRFAGQAGFTLLEMLVVMVLLSIIMVALVSAMRTAGQSGERVDAKLEQQDEARVAENFVRGALGRISARPLMGASLNAPSTPASPTTPQGASRPPVLFSGMPDQISWVGILPARYGAGGRNFMHLAVEPVGNTAALVLRYGPWADQNEFPSWEGLASQVLLTGVVAVNISYENDRPANMDADTEWESPWAHADYLPARAVIDIQRATQAPLQWVIPLWALPFSRPGGVGGGGVTIGGGGSQ